MPTARKGSLTIVGTGIRLVGQITLDALASIEQAQKVLYLAAEPVMQRWIEQRNPTAESLHDCYASGKPRKVTYREMVKRILAHVRKGLDVTVAFYGHPGFFSNPTHSAIRQARREGYRTALLPAVSSVDCLFADLGLDPGVLGWQSYEASDFLNRRPRLEPKAALILWQISVIGEGSVAETVNREGLQMLADALGEHYPSGHEVVVYQAAWYPVCDPVVRRVPLRMLPSADIPMMATLFVPPRRRKGPRTRPTRTR